MATLATGCSSQSAAPPSTATIPLQFDNDQPDAAALAPSLETDTATGAAPLAADTDAERSDSKPDQPDTQANVEPPRTTSATTDQASLPLPMSDQGVALGCTDATELRRWLGTSAEPVASIASTMPDQVWLCPQSPEVTTQLDCFPEATAAILRELAVEIGPDIDDIVSQITSSNTAFCTSGDAIRLGLDDILDQIDTP